MFSVRRIACEILPLVVLAWATFAILGGPLKTVEHGGMAYDESPATAGLGICAVTVALVLRTGVRRILPAPGLVTTPVRRTGDVLRAARPAAYREPPPSPPSLERLQVLRT
jgi:hypothetical protein